ncbi:MAG: DUF177 domain-containing protein [Alphaproteobacteria bacterium]
MTKKKKESAVPEWSHFVVADKIGGIPTKLALAPGVEERKRLARRAGVSDLKSLEADLTMSRDTGSNVIFISGTLTADVVQHSVISNKPVKSTVTDSFEAWYADPNQAVSFVRAKQERLAREGQAGETPILDENEDPEPILDGKIDVGELVAQYLCLAIDPYPQLEGENFASGDEKVTGKDGSHVYENPFAALKNWKRKQEKEEF